MLGLILDIDIDMPIEKNVWYPQLSAFVELDKIFNGIDERIFLFDIRFVNFSERKTYAYTIVDKKISIELDYVDFPHHNLWLSQYGSDTLQKLGLHADFVKNYLQKYRIGIYSPFGKVKQALFENFPTVKLDTASKITLNKLLKDFVKKHLWEDILQYHKHPDEFILLSLEEQDFIRYHGKEPVIGFFADFVLEKSLDDQLWHFHFDRLLPMAKKLKRFKVETFLYNPALIDYETRTAKGYIVGRDSFTLVKRRVPSVNFDFCLNIKASISKVNISYDDFFNWCKKNNRFVYSSSKFDRFAMHKNQSFKVIQEAFEGLQPHTARFTGKKEEFLPFIDSNNISFIKPIYGHRSENIHVLSWVDQSKNRCDVQNIKNVQERFKQGYLLEHVFYPAKFVSADLKKISYHDHIDSLESTITQYMNNLDFIIQQGIEIDKQDDGAALLVRVLMVNDGKYWHGFHIMYVGYAGTDVSNQTHSQRGEEATLPILEKLYGPFWAKLIINQLLNNSLQVCEFLEKLFPKEIAEVAYDFILSKDKRAYLLEINTKGAVLSPGVKLKSDMFKPLPQELPNYEQYLIPHGEYLADFALMRLLEYKKTFGV